MGKSLVSCFFGSRCISAGNDQNVWVGHLVFVKPDVSNTQWVACHGVGIWRTVRTSLAEHMTDTWARNDVQSSTTLPDLTHTHKQTTAAQSLNKHDKLLAKRQDNLQIY